MWGTSKTESVQKPSSLPSRLFLPIQGMVEVLIFQESSQ